MLATKEEIITQLAGAKARFEKIIREEEKSPKNIIANADMYAGSIVEYLETKSDQIRSIVQQLKELHEEFANQEPIEIKEGEEPAPSPLINKIVELRNELKKIVEEILEHVQTYYVVLWEYNVRITSKYYILLEILYEISNLPEMQDKLTKQEKITQRIRFQKLREEQSLFDNRMEKAEFAAVDWVSFARETVQPKLGEHSPIGFEKSYEAFANIVDEFIKKQRENMELVAGLIDKQVALRFKKILQMANELIAKAAV